MGSHLHHSYTMLCSVCLAPDPTDFPKTVPRPILARWTSLLLSTQGFTCSQPVAVITPSSRSGTLASSVTAKNLPVWIFLVPPFLGTLQWLCQG
ncbi:hypothetical protein VULLAG_LOCUS1559 [Vulpes lagopus]